MALLSNKACKDGYPFGDMAPGQICAGENRNLSEGICKVSITKKLSIELTYYYSFLGLYSPL